VGDFAIFRGYAAGVVRCVGYSRASGAPAKGGVLQVVQTVKSDTFSTASTSFTDLTGLSASITPRDVNSKILVLVHLNAAGVVGSNHVLARLLRGASVVYAGNNPGTGQSPGFYGAIPPNNDGTCTGAGMLLDSPASAASVTYKVQIMTNAGTAYVNRSPTDASQPYALRGVSSITLMEIAG
jgi:hypothetical protein